MPCAATSARASHRGCRLDRYGSSETTLTAASATPRPASWICSWRRCGSAVTRAAQCRGNPVTRATSLVTTPMVRRGRAPADRPRGGVARSVPRGNPDPGRAIVEAAGTDETGRMRGAELAMGTRRPAPGRPGRTRRAAAVAAVATAVVGLGTVAGCAARAVASPSIELATAYVPVPQAPGTTVAYVVIRNNGSADRLVAAHTSVGGRVHVPRGTRPGRIGDEHHRVGPHPRARHRGHASPTACTW